MFCTLGIIVESVFSFTSFISNLYYSKKNSEKNIFTDVHPGGEEGRGRVLESLSGVEGKLKKRAIFVSTFLRR